MKFLSILVFNLVSVVLGHRFLGSQTDHPDARSYIVKEKMINYSSNVPPMPEDAGYVSVLTNFVLLSLIEIDEQGQSMTTNGYLELEWTDERLAWDDEIYNARHVYYKHKELWHPDITVMNTVEKVKPTGETDFKTFVLANGTVMWYPGDIYKTSCDLKITYFPFDGQKCSLVVSPWLSSHDVTLITHSRKATMKGVRHSIWNIKSVKMKGITFDSTESIEIVLVLMRCPGYYLLNLLLPVLFLAGLISLVFVMPLDHNDRVSFAMTTLLSFVVFMTFLNDTLPKTSRQTSVIAVYVMCLFIISAVSVGLAICTLKIASYPQSKPIPNVLTGIIGWRRKLRKNRTSPETAQSGALPLEEYVSYESSVTWVDVGDAVDSFLMITMLLIIVGVSAVTFGIIAVNSRYGIYITC